MYDVLADPRAWSGQPESGFFYSSLFASVLLRHNSCSGGTKKILGPIPSKVIYLGMKSVIERNLSMFLINGTPIFNSTNPISEMFTGALPTLEVAGRISYDTLKTYLMRFTRKFRPAYDGSVWRYDSNTDQFEVWLYRFSFEINSKSPEQLVFFFNCKTKIWDRVTQALAFKIREHKNLLTAIDKQVGEMVLITNRSTVQIRSVNRYGNAYDLGTKFNLKYKQSYSLYQCDSGLFSLETNVCNVKAKCPLVRADEYRLIWGKHDLSRMYFYKKRTRKLTAEANGFLNKIRNVSERNKVSRKTVRCIHPHLQIQISGELESTYPCGKRVLSSDSIFTSPFFERRYGPTRPYSAKQIFPLRQLRKAFRKKNICDDVIGLIEEFAFESSALNGHLHRFCKRVTEHKFYIVSNGLVYGARIELLKCLSDQIGKMYSAVPVWVPYKILEDPFVSDIGQIKQMFQTTFTGIIGLIDPERREMFSLSINNYGYARSWNQDLCGINYNWNYINLWHSDPKLNIAHLARVDASLLEYV